MLDEADKTVVIHREMSPVQTWAERPLSQEEDITPKAMEKKQYYSLQMHTGTKTSIMVCWFNGLMELKFNCLAIMTIEPCGGKREAYMSENTNCEV